MGRKWRTTIEVAGQAVTVYERKGSTALWYSAKVDGRRLRRSLKTTDRELAVKRGQAIARKLALADLTGVNPADLTVERLRTLYLTHRGPLLSPARRRWMKHVLGLLVRHTGPESLVGRFDQDAADSYVRARQTGRLVPDDRRASDSPSNATLRNELQAFSTAANWAMGRRPPLLSFNPFRGLTLPEVKNRAQPVASEARYRALLEVADEADPEGRLRPLLVLAWETGRRINAIVHLRVSDILLTEQQLRDALAGAGLDDSMAEAWGTGLRWRAEFDKVGYLDFSPMNATLEEVLGEHLRRRAAVGEAWAFPGNSDSSEPLDKQMASHYLRKAEKLADLPHQRRGGWHAFRRAWATRRKHLPVQDVMKAGGWRDVKALQAAYQQSDPETVRRVMDLG